MPIDLSPLKIALLQLYSNGDCLFATVVARQIKTDYPNSTLSWYIGNTCKSILENNPDIDSVIAIDIKNKDAWKIWHDTHNLVQEKQKSGEYDMFFSTQIIADNEANYNGTIRGTILENYPNPITVSYMPVIRLTPDEIKNAVDFVRNNNILSYKNIVLFECAPISGQVPLNPKIGGIIAELSLATLSDTCFILTSGEKIHSGNKHIFDASVLTIRENAELINHCTHFIGCSSGISWLNSSSWCKPLPILQLLDNTTFYFNSMCRDYKYNHLDSTLITEIKFVETLTLARIVIDFVDDHISAKKKCHIELKDRSRTIYTLGRRFVSRNKYKMLFRLLRNTFSLNKYNPHYYYKILKIFLLSPVFILKGFQGESKK